MMKSVIKLSARALCVLCLICVFVSPIIAQDCDPNPGTDVFICPVDTYIYQESPDVFVTGEPIQGCDNFPISYTFEDETIFDGMCATILRTFTITDEINNLEYECVQQINVLDDDFIDYQTSFEVPCDIDLDDLEDMTRPVLVDCFPEEDFEIYYEDNDILIDCDGDSFLVQQRLWYLIIDDFPFTIASQFVTFIDDAPPNAICQQDLVFDFNGNETYSYAPQDLDNDSTDACSEVLFDFAQLTLNASDYQEGQIIQLPMEVTDLCGKMSTCMSSVSLINLPLLEVNCPADIELTVEEGACGAIVEFDITYESDGINPVSITQTDMTGLQSGDLFPFGTYMLSFNVDNTIESVDCELTVTIDPISDVLDALACNNQINVSVGEGCSALITPDMMLEGGPYGCWDNYSVLITDQFGNPISNPIVYDENWHSNEFSVQVSNINTGNTCWGVIVVEDKLDPIIECDCPPGAWLTDTDCQYNCLEVGRLISGQLGKPDVDDNCDQADAVFTGYTINDGSACGEYIVSQNWTLYVADDYGNYTNTSIGCVSEYYVTTADISLVDLPAAEITIACENAGPNSFDPSNTGYPELAGDELSGNSYCNLVAYYSDVELEACSGLDGSGLVCDDFGKVIRTWTVLDWCSAETTNFTQVIKILDIEAPELTATDIIVSVDPWECAADVLLGPDYSDHITIEDNCSSGLSWFITGSNSGGIITGNSILNIPKGNWVVTIGSADCCGNIGYVDINVNVIDATPPIPVAHQDLIVGLTSAGGNGTNDSGKAKIFKENIDNGSFDMCSDVHLEIRRDTDNCGVNGNATYSDLVPQGCSDFHRNNDHDYGGFVSFCCQDLNVDGDGDGEADGMIKVWLRVWDDANMDGMYGSFEFVDGKCELLDNFNETWVYVTVEDKSPSYIVCPPDITIPCDWDHTDLSITGEATGTSTCGTVQVEYSDWGDIECGSGVITREWTIVGEDVYQCNQTITVTSEGNQDVNVQCANNNEVIVDCDDYEIPDPWYGGGACNLVGISSTIDTFFFEADACYKVIKEWTIIDWCTGDEYFCDFTLAMIDTDAPEIMCQDTCVAVDDYWDADNDGNYCELANDIVISNGGATDEGACPSEWIKWTIQIDYFNDGDYDAEYSSFLPHNSSFYVAPTQMGTDVTVRLNKNAASSEWAYHAIKWIAFDGCGNFNHCVQMIEIADKKAPTPYCIGISTALMSPEAGNLVELWASDFNIGSFDNCSSPEDLLYTFDGVAPVLDRLDQVHYFDASGLRNATAYEGGYPVQKWNPATNSSATKFIGLDWCGMNDVEISVWDEKFNTDYCLVELLISGVECPDDPGVPRADLVGQITTEEGETVEAVTVENNSNQSGYPRTESTPIDGTYAFMGNIMYQDYSLRPIKDNGHLNGVSTLDLVLIQRHVLGLAPLGSGYKLIAADINNNTEVSATDLVELRRLILGIYSQLPENTSWRFVNSELSLDPTNPWPFTETREILSLDEDLMTEDFVGIKVGDVNGSVVANTGFTSPDIDSRASNKLDIILEQADGSIIFKAGENYSDIYGYQFTLLGVTNMSQVSAGAIELTDQHVALLANGALTLSYSSATGKSIAAGEVLFSLKAVGNVSLDKAGYVKAEAYKGSNFDILDIELRNENPSRQLASLGQNEPNPFSHSTEVNFSIPTDGAVTFTVYNITGKVIYAETEQYPAGVHVKTFNQAELGQTTGVLYVEMKTDEFNESIKMIKLK